jgi:hypothetical protein
MTSAKLIDHYIAATDNEIAVDEYFYSLLKLQPHSYGFIPRPEKWLSRYRAQPFLLRLLSFLTRLIWRLGGATAFFSFQFLREWTRWLTARSLEKPVSDVPTYFILISPQAEKLLHTGSVSLHVDRLVIFPWLQFKCRAPSNRILNPISLLGWPDLLKALYLSIKASSRLNFKSPKWALQGYTAYRWFLAYLALSRLGKGHYIISQHFDRWAILVDALVADLNATMSSFGQSSGLTLVQHGELKNLSGLGNPEELPFRLPNPLVAVSRLFAFDQSSVRLFLKSIVKSAPETNLFEPKIELSSLPESDLPDVLIVGHPSCKALHTHIYRSLQEMGCQFHGYYKPHPTMPKDLAYPGWTIITHANTYPNVDLVIAYPSTLARQYNLAGIQTVIHPIDLSPEESESCILEIFDKIKLITTHQRSQQPHEKL